MKIILGISGSIAAYKAAYLTRLLVKQGAEVQILMSESAQAFIAPITLSTLSKRPVFSELISESAWNNHVELGLWADAYLIAPATANTIANLANGLCNNILSAVYLSARCPVFVAPAMDLDMWRHPATQANIRRLQEHGAKIIPVGHGELASGLVGDGRMAEPEEIVTFVNEHVQKPNATRTSTWIAGKKALVTAGPTFEALDPIRFLGNHSTGKMGISLAEVLAEQGASVTLVLGPTDLKPSNSNIVVTPVNSANEMYDACKAVVESMDLVILAAAVADYRPKFFSETKIKKNEADMSLELVKTVDIAATLGKLKKKHQIFIGFALETNDEESNARKKLEKKNLDFIVLNSTRDAGAAFGHDTNKITILRRDGSQTKFPLKSKKAVAEDIVAEICKTANLDGA
ncbi:MAG: bifunctional phosphopantothenoylcysteine decarboxylase/phosphopantothenate--cysteine ligase CoaBC [Saprospiraceae bacterium]